MSFSPTVIGVDESGKGDFFGPLVIAAFSASDEQVKTLVDAGIKDGKKLSNNRIQLLDEYLRRNFAYAVVVYMPEEYNQLYEKIRNLNKFLAEGHARSIAEILERTGADKVVSDKFGKTELLESALAKRKIDIELDQIVRGEAITQVAAASIIARAEYLNRMKQLSDDIGFDLPRGAAPLVDEAGQKLVEIAGVDILKKVAKLHFKNYQRVLNPRFI